MTSIVTVATSPVELPEIYDKIFKVGLPCRAKDPLRRNPVVQRAAGDWSCEQRDDGTEGPLNRASPADVSAVAALLGRPPKADFVVAVRTSSGAPAVLKNAPFERDGTPMPTRYWLADPALIAAVGRIEAAGGVRAAEAAVDPLALASAHARYAGERDAEIGPDHRGPRPNGGVAGTRTGVKCLHAHYAWFLAGGDDPVGRWVADRLAVRSAPEPADAERIEAAEVVGVAE